MLITGGGGGVFTKVLYGEAPPRGPAPCLLYSIFDRNDSPFVYFPLTNGSTPSLQLNYNYIVLSNKYISEHHIKRYKKTKINFDELLAVNNCKVVSIFFKFAHPFLLLYFLCYPYRQFFMFFFFRCFERFILCFTQFGDGSHCLNFD